MQFRRRLKSVCLHSVVDYWPRKIVSFNYVLLQINHIWPKVLKNKVSFDFRLFYKCSLVFSTSMPNSPCGNSLKTRPCGVTSEQLIAHTGLSSPRSIYKHTADFIRAQVIPINTFYHCHVCRVSFSTMVYFFSVCIVLFLTPFSLSFSRSQFFCS